MDLRESGWGKRICLACGARLGERDGKPMQHLEPPKTRPTFERDALVIPYPATPSPIGA